MRDSYALEVNWYRQPCLSQTQRVRVVEVKLIELKIQWIWYTVILMLITYN